MELNFQTAIFKSGGEMKCLNKMSKKCQNMF